MPVPVAAAAGGLLTKGIIGGAVSLLGGLLGRKDNARENGQSRAFTQQENAVNRQFNRAEGRYARNFAKSERVAQQVNAGRWANIQRGWAVKDRAQDRLLAKEERQIALEDYQNSGKRIVEAAEEAGFSPLTFLGGVGPPALPSGVSRTGPLNTPGPQPVGPVAAPQASALASGAPPPLATGNTLAAGFQGLGDSLVQAGAQDDANRRFERELDEIKAQSRPARSIGLRPRQAAPAGTVQAARPRVQGARPDRSNGKEPTFLGSDRDVEDRPQVNTSGTWDMQNPLTNGPVTIIGDEGEVASLSELVSLGVQATPQVAWNWLKEPIQRYNDFQIETARTVGNAVRRVLPRLSRVTGPRDKRGRPLPQPSITLGE